MVKVVSLAINRPASTRVNRVPWGCFLLRNQVLRSHAAAAAPSDSNTEGLAKVAPESDLLPIEDQDADVAEQYTEVTEMYNSDGELDEQHMAANYGVKRDENGDIVFAQLDDDGKLSFSPDVEPYDPMFNGKWVEIDGVDVKMPDYDFSQHDWVTRVESDIGWPMFWRHFEDLTATDDEYVDDGLETYTESGRLALHSEHKRQEALEAQELFAGSPIMAAPGLDVDEPNQVDEATIQDRVRRDEIDEWELRAIREKKLARDQWDFYWAVQQMERMDMINTPPSDQRDVRYVPKLRRERFDWTEEEIQDVITNDGRAVDPDIVLHAPTFKTLNPYHMPDYAGQGIEYLEDFEDWLEEEGRWMDQQNLKEVGEDVESEDEEWTPERFASATDTEALGPEVNEEDLSVGDEADMTWGSDSDEEAE